MLSFPEVKEDSYKSPSDGPEVKGHYLICSLSCGSSGKLAYESRAAWGDVAVWSLTNDPFRLPSTEANQLSFPELLLSVT